MAAYSRMPLTSPVYVCLNELITYNYRMEDIKQIQEIKEWLGTGSINLFGSPYTGKDTQGKRLAELFDTPLIGSGDILRNADIPTNVKEIMQAGKLVPSEDFTRIILPYLSQPELQDKPLVLSSVGRWSGEEVGVIEALEQSGHELKAVVVLNIPEEDVWERWRKANELHDRGERQDDSGEELIKTRLEEFRSKTLPVLSYYRQMGILLEVDGTNDRDTVERDIMAKLLEFSKESSNE